MIDIHNHNVMYTCFKFIQPLLGAVSNVPIPGQRKMNDSFPVLHALHLKKNKDFLKECYPEFAVIMDGMPILF